MRACIGTISFPALSKGEMREEGDCRIPEARWVRPPRVNGRDTVQPVSFPHSANVRPPPLVGTSVAGNH
jgi:hypothetical protein